MKSTNKVSAILLALVVSTAALAGAATGALSWTRPTLNTDGTALLSTDITGYDVVCTGWTPTGGVRGACTQFPTVTLPGGNTVAGVVNGTILASGGQACWTMATKTLTAQSAPSGEACKTFAPVIPNAPTGVTIAVVLSVSIGNVS
jgi:hypothetical protein